MNRLEEIINKFIEEKKEIKKEIANIEAERDNLACQRNEKKAQAYTGEAQAEINELGRKISELGCKSQELQNEIDCKFISTKRELCEEVEGLILEQRKEISIIEQTKQEVQNKIQQQEDRNLKYEAQRQEFFAKFGRMPDISERAQRENQIREEQCGQYREQITQMQSEIKTIENKIAGLEKQKIEFRKGNFEYISAEKEYIVEEPVEEQIILPAVEEVIVPNLETVEHIEENIQKEVEELEPIEEIKVEEFEPLEEIKVEEFEPIQELKVEEFVPIEEIKVEELEPIQEIQVEEFAPVEEIKVEEFEPIEEIKIEEFVPIEEIAVEKFEPIEETQVEEFKVAEEIEEPNFEQVQEKEEIEIGSTNVAQAENFEEAKAETEVDITEKEQAVLKEVQELEAVMENYVKQKEIFQTEEVRTGRQQTSQAVTYGERVTILDIIAKVKDREVLYIASLSNGEQMRIYPNRKNEGKILEREKENINEIKEILIDYAIAEYRTLDKKAIRKIDPVVCEILIRFAKKYDYNAQNLLYSYAMTFSKNEEVEIDTTPQITYNLYIGEDAKVSKKEKEVLSKICRNARKNDTIEIIGYTTALKKIRYIFKKTFNLDKNRALSEGKY